MSIFDKNDLNVEVYYINGSCYLLKDWEDDIATLIPLRFIGKSIAEETQKEVLSYQPNIDDTEIIQAIFHQGFYYFL